MVYYTGDIHGEIEKILFDISHYELSSEDTSVGFAGIGTLTRKSTSCIS